MTAASGKRFRCSIPHPSAPSSLEDPPLAATAAHSQPDTTTSLSTDDTAASPSTPESAGAVASIGTTSSSISTSSSPLSSPFTSLGQLSGRLRKKFRTGCFTLADGHWWMYELCPFAGVRQFHTDGTPPAGPDGSRYLSYQISSAFSLGKYDDEGDEWVWLSYGGKPVGPGVGQGEWVYVQHYGGGTDGRASAVRFLCNTSPALAKVNNAQQQKQQQAMAAVGDHRLVSIREDATYVYTFDVSTPLVCPTSKQPHTKHHSTTTPTSPALTSPTIPQPTTPPPPDYPNANSDLSRALQALHSLLYDECLTHFAGWWTYKFCYLDGLNQFHREARQQAGAGAGVGGVGTMAAELTTTAEYELGHFAAGDRGQSAALSTSKELPAQTTSGVSPSEVVMRTTIVQGASWEETYVRQLYTDGTACEVKTGLMRQTEVRFVCDSNSQQQQQQQQQGNAQQQQQQQQQQRARAAQSSKPSVLVSIGEDSTCRYVAVVAVPALCSHPLFSPELPTVHEIQCTEVKDTSR